MRFAVVESDIRNILDNMVLGNISAPRALNDIMTIIFTESWTHTDDHKHAVTLENMTDAEFRMLSMWVRANHPSKAGSSLQFIKDMREVFPGLNLAAAHYIVNADRSL